MKKLFGLLIVLMLVSFVANPVLACGGSCSDCGGCDQSQGQTGNDDDSRCGGHCSGGNGGCGGCPNGGGNQQNGD